MGAHPSSNRTDALALQRAFLRDDPSYVRTRLLSEVQIEDHIAARPRQGRHWRRDGIIGGGGGGVRFQRWSRHFRVLRQRQRACI